MDGAIKHTDRTAVIGVSKEKRSLTGGSLRETHVLTLDLPGDLSRLSEELVRWSSTSKVNVG